MDFDIKKFYKEQNVQEEMSFTQSTGIPIRHSFQQYNEGTDNEEVFAVKTISKRESFGIDFHGSVSYLLPITQQDTLLFIFDKSLMPIINVLSDWSEPRLEIYGRHVPSLMNALQNAVLGELYDIGTFVDDEMLCFVKQINYPLIDKIKEGYIADYGLIGEVLSIIQYRNKCESEIISFEGFSEKEEKEIALKEGLNIVRKGLRYVRFFDFVSSAE